MCNLPKRNKGKVELSTEIQSKQNSHIAHQRPLGQMAFPSVSNGDI